MRLLVADDIGLVKEANLADKSIKYLCNTSGADQAVGQMTWLNPECTKVAVCRINGTIDIYALSSSFEWKHDKSIDIEEPVIATATTSKTLLVATEESVCRISLEDFSIETKPIVDGPFDHISFMRLLSTSSCNTPAEALPTRLVAARGDSPPVVIDLLTNKLVWSGKNANDTSIGLCSKFSTVSLLSLSDRIFAAGDVGGKLRFYDIVTQRKPVYEFPVYEVFTLTNNYTGTSGMGCKRPISQLATSFDGSTLFLGDTYGTVIGLDIRKLMASNSLIVPDAKLATKTHTDFCRKLLPMISGLKGIMGSVRGIHATESNIFVVSAGRFAYSFDVKTKGKKNEKLFLKQKLTCCLPIDSACPESTQTAAVDELEFEDEETDELVDSVLSHAQPGDDSVLSKSKRRRMRKGAAAHS